MPKKEARECDIMEGSIASDLKGKTTRGSGSAYDDADVKNKFMLVEAKLRNKQSFTVKKDDLFKVIKQARDRCKLPVLVYQNEDGSRIAVLPYEDFLAIAKESMLNELL